MKFRLIHQKKHSARNKNHSEPLWGTILFIIIICVCFAKIRTYQLVKLKFTY